MLTGVFNSRGWFARLFCLPILHPIFTKMELQPRNQNFCGLKQVKLAPDLREAFLWTPGCQAVQQARMSLCWKGVPLHLGGFSCVHLSVVIQWHFGLIPWKNKAWCSPTVSVYTCWKLLNMLSNQRWQGNQWVLICENRWVRKEGRPTHWKEIWL